MIPETFFTVGEQFRLFFISILFGFPIGLFYDVFRILRIIIPHNSLAAALEDILFFAVYSVFITSFTYAAARSEFRIYYIAGNITGFFIYWFTAGKILTGTALKITMFVKSILKKQHFK